MKKALSTLFILVFMMNLSAQSLTFMTYNIRYANPRDSINYWENRKEEVANQIVFYEPDILGIQEGLPQQVDYLDQALDEYSYYGVGRDDGKRKGEFSAIFYKKEKFIVKQKETFWLSPTPNQPSKGWDAALPRICTTILFTSKADTTKLFWVFNTHFDHRGDEARLKSVDVILGKAKSLNPNNFPLIVMGDLNLTPETPPIKKLFDSLVDPRKISKVVFGPYGTWSSFDVQKKLDRRIDYIAVSEGIGVSKYAVLTDNRDLRNYSDHLPVFIEADLFE
jgi:endonuclease/exonuclease/phosphatase family metal-dependent hydrolase